MCCVLLPADSRFGAFLSYARKDDKNDDGRITKFRNRLEGEIRLLSGEDFSIFQDREGIAVGQPFDDVLEDSLSGSMLLIAVITPAFLRSEACRQEVRLFTQRERHLGRKDLIIPLLYVDTPGLDDPDDEVARLLKSRQYCDWTALRLEDPNSRDVRTKTSKLANQIIDALRRSSGHPIVEKAPEEETGSESLGFLERLAEYESAAPSFTNTLVSLAEVTKVIGENLSSATAEITAADKRGRPFSARLAILVRLRNRLDEPAAEMEQETEEYLRHLAQVSAGVYAVIEQVPTLEKEDDIEAAKELLQVLADLADNTGNALDSLAGFQESLAAGYQLSSTLRPVLRRMSVAAGKMLPTRQVFEGWRDDLSDALFDLLIRS